MTHKKAYPAMHFMVLSLFLGVMVWHALDGERGWLTMTEKKHEVQALRDELSALHQTQGQLQQKVSDLSEQTLNLDVLEDYVRHHLGLYRENERVFYFSQEK